MAQERLPNGLPVTRRFLTDHNQKGEAVFSTRVEETLPWQDVMDVKFGLGYTTSDFPVELKDEKDLVNYEHHLENKPGITVPGGTVLRLVDMPPGHMSPMHRTVSLDYGVVLEGEVALILDSGEERLLRQGDIAIQRATSHAWLNKSKTSWARMMYVLQEAQPFEVGGRVLGENYGTMEGVRASDQRAT